MNGVIFDIREFTLHDGPGPRTTVFLKGCPLHCTWCHNPEGLTKNPQLIINHNLCIKCGKCHKLCNHTDCQPFTRCLHACPNGLIHLCGQIISSSKLVEILMKNIDFYTNNGGGVTFSGGEPLMQSEFLLDVIDKLNYHIAIQTSGYADPQTFRNVIEKVDYVMMDIKIADRELHKRNTGVYNDVILTNFKILKDSGKDFIIRTPLIPEICDTSENLKSIKSIIDDSPWEKLPFNNLSNAKESMICIKD